MSRQTPQASPSPHYGRHDSDELSERFFPNPRPQHPPPEPHNPRLFMSQNATPNDVRTAIYGTSLWKAAGPDDLSNALLRACG